MKRNRDVQRALAEAREGEPDEGSGDLDALFHRVEAAVERERGPAAWLRSRSTPARITIAVAAVALVGIGSYLVWGRARLHDYSVERLVAVLGTLAVLVALAVAVSLRPLHRPPMPRWRIWAVALAAVALPAGLAMWPHTSGAGPFDLHALGPDVGRCFGMGSVLAVPVLLLWRGLRRARATGERLVLGGAVVGLAGNVALQCQCPAVEPLHLLWGHAGVVMAFVLGAALWTLLGSSRHPRGA